MIDGTDPQVNDADEVRTVAAAFNDQGWPAEVDGNGLTAEYSAPSAGPPPWHVYRITPVTVFASVQPKFCGATRFEVSS